jgi:hypothetical protein
MQNRFPGKQDQDAAAPLHVREESYFGASCGFGERIGSSIQPPPSAL